MRTFVVFVIVLLMGADRTPVRTIPLESLTPVAEKPAEIAIAPGQLKAFESGESVSWVIVPGDTATPDGLFSDDGEPGTIVIGYDLDAKRFGKFRVPAGKTVFLVAANPTASGRYTLIRQRVEGGKVKEDARVILVVGGKPQPAPQPDDDKKPEPPKPEPAKLEKLRLVVLRDPNDMRPTNLILADAQFWKSFADRGHIVRFYAPSDADGKAYYGDVADGTPLPVLLVYDNANTAKPIKTIPFPLKRADLEAYVKEVSK